jgi:hypothetical protein
MSDGKFAYNEGGHYAFPADCPACAVSIRPACLVCGHALTGALIGAEQKTTCGVCGTEKVLKPAKVKKTAKAAQPVKKRAALKKK